MAKGYRVPHAHPDGHAAAVLPYRPVTLHGLHGRLLCTKHPLDIAPLIPSG